MSSILSRIQSFVQEMVKGTGSATDEALGSTWQNELASQAFQAGTLRSSSGSSDKVRVAFRNVSSLPILLCWISDKGTLHHFYRLPPSSLGTNDPVGMQDHVENTRQGHAFCILTDIPEEERLKAKESKSLPSSASLVGGYRPSMALKERNSLHLVEIGQQRQGGDTEDIDDALMNCCGPIFGLRGSKNKKRKLSSASTRNSWFIKVRKALLDPTPFDTTSKHYDKKVLGGWPCWVEPNWHGGDVSIETRLKQDLEYASKCLPPHAREYLQKNCPIWINKTIKYGPKACPVRGKGCCFHPDGTWLKENGLSEEKAKCVEINDGPYYGTDVHLWGTGGLILHELSHAYHNCMLEKGYDNNEIRKCFEAAMKEKLYECVEVKGKQGPTAKAYACTNEMEYFAELSAAFLGGIGDFEEEKYNKWYPFNRKQVEEHDPRAYQLLSKLWRVSTSST